MGQDTLTGGAGRDKFVFDAQLSSKNVDTITEFKHGWDRITLDDKVFTSLQKPGLFIPEYVEGMGFNKAIELFNATGKPIDLAAEGYALELYSNGAPTVSFTMNLNGVVSSGDVFVIANGSADVTFLAAAGATNSTVINFNGDDTVVQKKFGVVVDAIGQIGIDPGLAWISGGVSTADQTLVRNTSIISGDTIATDLFDPSVQWQGFAVNTFSGLGSHAGTASSTLPADAFTTSAPTTASQRIIYDSTTGSLSYEADGSGVGAAVQFASVKPGNVLTADDIVIV